MNIKDSSMHQFNSSLDTAFRNISLFSPIIIYFILFLFQDDPNKTTAWLTKPFFYERFIDRQFSLKHTCATLKNRFLKRYWLFVYGILEFERENSIFSSYFMCPKKEDKRRCKSVQNFPSKLLKTVFMSIMPKCIEQAEDTCKLII